MSHNGHRNLLHLPLAGVHHLHHNCCLVLPPPNPTVHGPMLPSHPREPAQQLFPSNEDSSPVVEHQFRHTGTRTPPDPPPAHCDPAHEVFCYKLSPNGSDSSISVDAISWGGISCIIVLPGPSCSVPNGTRTAAVVPSSRSGRHSDGPSIPRCVGYAARSQNSRSVAVASPQTPSRGGTFFALLCY